MLGWEDKTWGSSEEGALCGGNKLLRGVGRESWGRLRQLREWGFRRGRGKRRVSTNTQAALHRKENGQQARGLSGGGIWQDESLPKGQEVLRAGAGGWRGQGRGQPAGWTG